MLPGLGADPEIKVASAENLQLSKAVFLKSGAGQMIALPAARNSALLIFLMFFDF